MLDSRALRALLSLGMVVGLGATGTYAYWTDTAVITGTTITAGTIDLKASAGPSGFQDNPSDFASMTVTSMVPGDTTAGIVTIKNSGTAPLNYSATSFGSNGDNKSLATALTVKVTLDTAVSGSGRAVACAGAAIAGSGTSIGLLATPANLLSSATPRTLAAGAEEKLCIQVGLPTNANTALQGATTNLTFTFNGTSF